MDVAIAGAHGQVARRLTRLLAARGDRVRGIIRAPEHSEDLRRDGAEPVVLDLEQVEAATLAEAIAGCDAVVFAAGAGAGSGAERKATVDYGAAVTLLDAARQTDVRRYVMVSSTGAADPPQGDDVFNVYLRAKAAADAALIDSDRDWTVVRPGRLTDDPGTGRVAVAGSGKGEDIPRDDVAAVLLAVLDAPGTSGAVFEVVAGDVPVADAVAGAAAGGGHATR